MTKSSDDIIILSDEEDDIKIESIITPKRPTTTKPINNSRPIQPKTSPKRRAPILVLTEPKSISYGIDIGGIISIDDLEYLLIP